MVKKNIVLAQQAHLFLIRRMSQILGWEKKAITKYLVYTIQT